jgi:hypothetical protein
MIDLNANPSPAPPRTLDDANSAARPRPWKPSVAASAPRPAPATSCSNVLAARDDFENDRSSDLLSPTISTMSFRAVAQSPGWE